MTATLALTTILYAAGLTVWLVVQAYRPETNHRVGLAALIVLELALIMLAGADLLAMAQGRRPRDMAVHIAYLGASVAVLPLVSAIGFAGSKGQDSKGSGSIVPAVGCAAAVVIVMRLQITGGA